MAELSCSGVLLAGARRTNAVSKISLRFRFFGLWAAVDTGLFVPNLSFARDDGPTDTPLKAMV